MKMLAKAIAVLLKKYYLSNLIGKKNAEIGKNVKFGDIHYFEINSHAKEVIIGDNVKFYSQVNLTVGKSASLRIGANTTINKYTSIVALDGVQIGENCLVGENVKIYDNNHKIDIVEGIQVPNHKEFSVGKVTIGNNVWLTSNVTILKGVTIGDNSVIGAGCVIFKDVPANSTVVNKQELIVKNNS